MSSKRFVLCMVVASVVAITSCATSPEDERRKRDMEADIDEILTYELDETEYGEPKSCLSESEYRSFRALGDRHLLFRGRQGKLWVNVLRGRCFNLDDDSKFIMRPNMSGRLCDKDRFGAVSPLDTMPSTGAGLTCVLGEFKPVSEAQVGEIEDRLEMR